MKFLWSFVVANPLGLVNGTGDAPKTLTEANCLTTPWMSDSHGTPSARHVEVGGAEGDIGRRRDTTRMSTPRTQMGSLKGGAML
ncbi:hypothetical protein M758_UG012100 [Ceratodon purpureus]|nr:hypothetical protein M758_UG012100 [Ceratodon purpureus]